MQGHVVLVYPLNLAHLHCVSLCTLHMPLCSPTCSLPRQYFLICASVIFSASSSSGVFSITAASASFCACSSTTLSDVVSASSATSTWLVVGGVGIESASSFFALVDGAWADGLVILFERPLNVRVDWLRAAEGPDCLFLGAIVGSDMFSTRRLSIEMQDKSV